MQCGVRENRVERLIGAKRRAVLNHEWYFGIRRACLCNHVGRAVDADYRGAGFRDVVRQVAGAATEIENSLARFGIKKREQRGAVVGYEAAKLVVSSGVPHIRIRRA